MDQISRTLDQSFTSPMPGAGSGQFSDWRALPADFVLIQALVVPDTDSTPSNIAGFLLLFLNRHYFKNEFLAGIMQHSFSSRTDTEFEAAAVIRNREQQVLCSSESKPGARMLENPDLRIPLLGDLSSPAFSDADTRPQGTMARFGQSNLPVPMIRVPQGHSWELVADFRSGPLDVIVSRSRIRNLVISFGVLLLLGIGMTLIIWGARRSHRLAKLQMRFVAGVSHDLRTPLSVIGTAADNLAEGVVEDSSSRVKEYGALIRSEARKLSSMVEQILQYASLTSGSGSIHLEPVSVDELFSKVLADEKPLSESLGFSVEVEAPTDLQEVLGDRALLEQALRNLLSNALKHGASKRWVRLRAERGRLSNGDAISISVDDRGAGIHPDELPHVFEPFYRGRDSGGTPGSGLGLTVVKQSVEMMGGRVSVSSQPGRGCSFRIVLRSAGRREKLPADKSGSVSHEPYSAPGDA
jgi:signal transduction histidine kinase